ncbi:hypothetical protein JYU34_003913 [Plutella xylostella]|uniref:DNA mismatch repair proteins mutS family domain-containing protein n=1 Tax=Plutella xylostella TaxID=51655 RepID=A0ABQ7R182_PLUXY|nr:hypothetical protein JYU34_003913 [Plutella xylostella]
MDGSTSSDGATSATIDRPQINNFSSPSEGSGDSRARQSQFVIAQCRRNTSTEVSAAPNASTNNENTEDSDTEDRILAVYWRAGKLGAAHYTIQTGELQVLEEIVDRAPAHQMLSNLIRRVEPSKLLVDGKAQGTFVSMVKKIVFANGNDSAEPACRLIFISAKEYNFEACKRRISSLSLPHEPRNCTEEERARFLRTILHFGQLQSVHALGALLRYVDLNWSSLSMDLHSKPQFMGLKKISLADIVTIDADTYKGLQIFSPVSHPSGFKKGARASDKEGLSLFSVFNKCASKVGQSRMRVLLQHPTNDIALLRQRQQVVGYFMRAQADTTLRNICSHCYVQVLLQHPTNDMALLLQRQQVVGYFMRAQADTTLRNICSSLRFVKNVNTLYNTVLICEMCENVAGASDFLDQLGSYDNNKLYEMALYMNRIIDFDLSKTEGKFTVKPGVDPELDRKKQTMAQLHGLMSETAKVELERLPPYIDECTMLYMPHLGYLLGVSSKTMTTFTTKAKGVKLDVMIGDTYPEIVAHETRIMMRLTTIVLENLQTLSAVIDKCAELDWIISHSHSSLIAISKVCKEFSFVQPELTHEKVIHITRGKHPLHLLTCDDFVPNDLHSDSDSGFVKIFTGPNASGKSVYMKQVGLIVYLAHIGSFVPADAATIGLLTHIYTRIQSTECIAAHMSAFLIDLRQMSLALQESTSNSLIIVDEFGKGTSEVDGISLLASCINSLLCRELNCPHVLLATHMLQLPEFIIKTPLVKFQRFEHIMQDDEPVFLFRLTDGAVGSSLALQVAASSGIERQVVDRAAVVMTCMMNNALPPENKKITAKLNSMIEMIKTDLLTLDI